MRARFFVLILVAFALCGRSAQAATDIAALPKPTGYVSDLAHVVNADDKAALEAFCTRIDQQLGVQLALVTIDTIGDTPIENFTIDLARAWGVGAKKDNSGVLLLLVVKDRKSRVEVGRGVEQYVNDGLAGATLRSMRPDLRAANYGAALSRGAHEIAAEIAQGKGVAVDEVGGLAPQQVPGASRNSGGIPFGQILLGIFAVLFVLSLFRRGGGGGGYRGGGGGFWTGFLLSSLLNSGGGRGDRSGWGGGGFGGDSGGGGGFGGFGGGDFGGGGASSDW